jgi:uncharacterized SAM-binding protein YcdF (DUF218 family)
MDDLFFYSSKIIWFVIEPSHLYLCLLSICILLLFTSYRKSARKILCVMLFFIWTVALFPVGSWLFYPLETRFQHNPKLPETVDGIIVLGGSISPSMSLYWQQIETNQYHERLTTFIQLAKIYPEAKLLFTGGSAAIKRNQPTEAEFARQYFIDSGVPGSRLIIEDKARNTAENIQYSKMLVTPKPDENWVVITTAFHMPRSIGLFCKQNWPVIPYPVDHATNPEKLFKLNFNLADHVSSLTDASHEWVGLLAYFLTGKIDQILPKTCH